MGGFSFVGLIEKVWFGIFGFYISSILLEDLLCRFGKFDSIDLVWYIWFGKYKLELVAN